MTAGRICTGIRMSRPVLRAGADGKRRDDPKGKSLLDYGCGKGRVDFFLSAQTRCRSIGVEYDDRIYAKAVENKKAAVSGARTEFVLESAENFPVPAEVDRVYFFNPFSLEILRKAMTRLLESYYENPREIQLFFITRRMLISRI